MPPSSTPPTSADAPVAVLPSQVGAVNLRRVALDRIKAAKYNPRRDLKPGDVEYEKLCHSIRTFGYVDPLIWNEVTGNLVGGHQRLKILRDEQKVSEVDVVVVNLTPPQEKALNVALNKISGDWDNPRLAELLIELQNDPAADVSATGFDPAEINALLAELEPGQGNGVPADKSDEGLDASSQVAAGLTFRVLIECRDEMHQRELLERLESEGLKCQALMS